MEDITVQEARKALDDWGHSSREVDRTRDPLVRLALRSGVSKMEIVRRTGLARTTVDRICSQPDLGMAAGRPQPQVELRLGGRAPGLYVDGERADG